MKALCIVLHDVAPPTWAAARAMRAAVRAVCPHAPVTLLVVPNYHERGTEAPEAYFDWLRACVAQGDEIALHGYTHLDPQPRGWKRRLYTAGEGEFAALDRAEATRRIASGRLWCARHGLAVRGFVAPAWLLGRESWEALSDFEFDYTTTLTRFVELRGGRSVPAPGIVYSARSRARRVLSCGWNALLARVAHAAPLVRVGLHPVDTCHPQVLHHAQALVRRLARHRECLTKRHVAARLRGRAA
ncbi:MAG: polysaccharide deacetylase family protein [Pseudomonadota bacterium]|nr:MAG: DUF2334 domain-containing protein [Pseudomonadota bacterium]